MEHRNGRRIQRALPLELWRGNHLLKNCRSNDFGQGGLSLTGVSDILREGELLTIKVAAGSLNSARQFERKAMVVYQSQNRLGLMWADVDTDFFTVLTAVNNIAA